MLFNSLVFILGFLPFVVIGYYALAAAGQERLRLPFIIVSSLIFYGYWTPQYTILLIVSTVLNYTVGLIIVESLRRGQANLRFWLVTSGVILNLSALCYYKYSNFFIETVNAVSGAEMELPNIILPLAISFYTFQQIGFLIDTGRGTIRPGGFAPYAAFVIFFPQLIAGPIVHFRELEPQISARPKLNRAIQNVLIGLIIFGIGLAKKTVFADTAALYSTPVFDIAEAGRTPGFWAAWAAAFAYTLQLYFDFSGYSDMAIGLARIFGVSLPLNFHSPLRAGSMKRLWRQWHMTLGRFVRSYIFQPVATPLTRWSAKKGHSRGASHRYAVLAPTFIAMLVIGIWHGDGWNFVIFGAMHGTYMVINEAWDFRRRQRRMKPLPLWLTVPVDRGGNYVLTLLAFVVASVPFRAADVSTTGHMYAGLLGMGSEPTMASAVWPLGVAGLLLTLIVGYLIVFLTPNTQQIMRDYAPSFDWRDWASVSTPVLKWTWRPTTFWLLLSGAVLCLGVSFVLRGTTEFIYFNF